MSTIKNGKPAGQITYARAVREGKSAMAAQGKANWKLGDIASNVEPKYGDNTIAELANAIGMAPGTLYDLRSVARAYGEADRSDNSWTVHQVFSREDDRVALVNGKTWSVREARDLVKSRKGDQDGPAGDGDGDGNGDGPGADVPETDEEKLLRLRKYRGQLEADLMKTVAAIAALEAKLAKVTKPAAKPTAPKAAPLAKVSPKTGRHVVPFKPSHAPADCTPACNLYVAPKAKAAKPAAKVTAKPAAKVTAKPAAKATAPKSTIREVVIARHMAFKGVPEHDTTAPRTDCPACRKAGIKPMPAPRKAGKRVPVAA